jgi:hypothetical protein
LENFLKIDFLIFSVGCPLDFGIKNLRILSSSP